MFTSKEQLQLFPTRVTVYRVHNPEFFRKPLVDLVLAASEELPPTRRGETQGWQSDNSFFDWAPQTRFLRQVILDLVLKSHEELEGAEGANIVGWANLFVEGNHFSPHNHANSAWSGSYYVDVGDSSQEEGGALLFRDPRGGAGMFDSPLNRFDNACTFQVIPKTGDLVIFPSWLVHWVTPYRGETPRVTVAFNVW